MIHYHGTPISGGKDELAKFIVGRHGLVSFEYPEPLPCVAEFSQSFVLDNGAFTKWSKGGGDVDYAAYIEWIEQWHKHPGFDWCLIPDKIDGDEHENKALIVDWPENISGVPVYHFHESFDHLEWLVNSFGFVALGSSAQWSSPGSGEWWKRMAEIMAVVCDSEGRPKCKLHGLRMLNPDIFTRLPLSSADSTNAGVNAGSISRFGSYVPPTSSQRAAVIAERIEVNNCAPVWSGFEQEELW